jgi:hypothetical protein
MQTQANSQLPSLGGRLFLGACLILKQALACASSVCRETASAIFKGGFAERRGNLMHFF